MSPKMRHLYLYLAGVVVVGLLQAAPQQASSAGVSPTLEGRPDPAKSVAPDFSAQDLAALPTSNWLKIGGDLFNRNYSPLKQVNRDNVANLKAVWRTHLDGSALATKYSGEAQPMVYEGVLYIVTGADDVFALSVKTGEILWKY